ncbi:Pogo transposable element with KRAB domain [Stylophora pistillata]|uniref:Pogo transposable element with KRAB domain n=1 Tax=Stylophora pistillata TaxID=50429 RepID=A0A2B4R4V0_STYPI|nr:Pogo transposable element with KRAB domain [Stylophora pistillata]
MMVFKGAKRELAALKQKFQQRAVFASSANGWMDPELAKVWVDSVLGSISFNRRLLASDSYECHLEDKITESLKSKKIDRVIVPGGCTKYIQAPDLSWKKPFKSSCTENYDEWQGTVGINEETAAENLRAPRRRAILQWILDAWAELPTEVMKRSFPSCALNLPVEGSNDDTIHCSKEGQPCSTGRAMLQTQLDIFREPDATPFACTDLDVEEAYPPSIICRIDDLVKNVADLKASLQISQQDISCHREKIKTINTDVSSPQETVNKHLQKAIYLENQSKSNNLRFEGLMEDDGESWEETKEKVKNTLVDKFNFELQLAPGVECAHRTGRPRRQDETP